MKLENKKRYLIILIIAIIAIISLGTYAWLTYRTNDTAMVLTVGDINNVRITMSPYQIDAKLSPNLTYTGQPYTTVEVVNNSSGPRDIRLFYTINAIDSELATSNLKYTIEKKAVGESNYTHITPDGNFAGATQGSEITIIDEAAPVGTTYYKVYVWLYSASSSQNNVPGKKFNAELNAYITNYLYTVSTTTVSIGEPIPNGMVTYQTADSAMANFDNRPFYLKHKINDGIIEESYVEFVVTPEMASANPGMTAGTYTLKGGDNGASYSTNVGILTTAFGEDNCEYHSSYVYCLVPGLGASADDYGVVGANDDSAGCCVDAHDGDGSYCIE